MTNSGTFLTFLTLAAMLLGITCASTPKKFAFTSSSYTLSPDGRRIVLSVSDDDLNEIKRLDDIGLTVSDTYLATLGDFVTDISQNGVTQIQSVDPLAASHVVLDTTAPVLSHFSLDVTGVTGTLYLTFTETVRASTFNATSITLQAVRDISANGASQSRFTLTGGVKSALDSTVLSVDLTHTDLNGIKAVRDLAKTQGSTYLVLSDTAVADMRGNKVVAIANTSAQLATGYHEDTTAPELVSFTLNMNSGDGVLTLSFSETVDVTTFDNKGLTLQDATCGNTWYRLTGGSHSSTIGDIVSVWLSWDDGNEIKRLTTKGFATSASNTYLRLDSSTVSDMGTPSNAVVGLANCSAIVANDFVEDRIAPVLTDFSLDLRINQLVLSFSETVKASTFDVTQVSLFYGSDVYALTAGPFSVVDATYIYVNLTTFDTNAIKTIGTIARSKPGTFIAISPDLVRDMNFNNNSAISVVALKIVNAYQGDDVSPRLTSFTINMNAGTLTLQFSETVKASSFTPAEVTVQQRVNGGSSVSLTSGTVLSSSTNNVPTLVVLLSPADLNSIKRYSDLAIDQGSTWLAATALSFTDIEGNKLVAIGKNAALPASPTYVRDRTNPLLSSFDLDLTAETLSLTFNEVISRNTVNVTAFAFQDSRMAFRDPSTGAVLYYYRLTGGQVSANNDVVIVIQLTTFDLNAIKSMVGLATSMENTYLTVDAAALTDRAGNPIDAIADGSAVQVHTHLQDSRAPTLDAFDFLMSPYGPPLQLLLKFSETVDIATFDVSKIRLQSERAYDANTSLFRRLTGGTSQPKQH